MKIIVTPAFSTASMTSKSRFEPPGWTTVRAPASIAACGPSAKGKNASEATTEPFSRAAASSPKASLHFSTASRTESTRLICPAPMPIVCRPLAKTIAFERTCLQTFQAKTMSRHSSSLGSPPVSTVIPSRSLATPSSSWTSMPPRTRFMSTSLRAVRCSVSSRIRIASFCWRIAIDSPS